LHYERAQEALHASQPRVAEEEFRKILRLNPKSAEAHANLGLVAYAQGAYLDAAREFQEALQLRPALWNAQGLLGMSYLRLGRVRQAMPILEKSFPHLQDAKVRAEVGMELIRLYSETQNLDRAVDVIRVLQRTTPTNPDALYAAYRTYSSLAAHALADLADSAPESARMHQILALTLESQDDFAGAIAQYRKALQIDPRLLGIHFELGRLILRGSHEEPARQQAQREFETELSTNPTHTQSEYQLGEIDWWRWNLAAALRHYSRAVELQPDFADAKIGVGKVLTIMGQPEKAVENLLSAAHIDPRNEAAHYRLALAYRKLGRDQDADREWAMFQKLRGSQAVIRELYQQVKERPAPVHTVEREDKPN
jgi:tetratricopeptide (TPR) repeat protein